MKTLKILLVITIVALLATAGYCYYSRNKQISVPSTAEVPQVPEKVTWSYEDLGTDKDTWAPSTKVTVTVWDKSYNAGTYAGSCSPRSHDGFGKNEASGITCWWAGEAMISASSTQITKITVQHRTLDEGTAEAGGVTGEFKILTSIE